MAIGEPEKAFIDAMRKHHEAGAKLAEDYLKKSDTASRPASAVSRAANMIARHAHEIEDLDHFEKYLDQGPNASKEAAARLMGGYEY